MQDKAAAAAAIREWVDLDVLPVQYGGTNALPMAEWPLEIELAEYVAQLNAGATPGPPRLAGPPAVARALEPAL